MNKRLISKILGVTLVCLMLGVMFGTLSSPANAATTRSTEVSGIISANTTWTLANSPYIVTGSTLVNPGVTLTIEPGVAVKFSSAKGLQVDGQLVARGTATQPIVFTSNQASPAPGDWVSILFTATSTNATYDGDGNYLSGSIMQYSTVEYGGWNNNPAIKIMSSAPFIDHSTISQNAYTGIYSENGSRKITNNTISYNGGGIFISGGTATISGNTISYNAGGLYSGIYIGGGMATISGNTISYNAGPGIRGGGSVTISGNTISNNSFGGIKLEGGSATITNNTINSNSCSSERYGGGGIGLSYGATATISHNTISNNSAVYGSGIYAGSTGGATISNNIITNNSGVSAGGGIYKPQGGGIYASNGPVTISRNTISNNYAYYGGGIYGGGTISNNIIRNNSASSNGGGIYASGGTISHNQITGNSISSGDGKGGGIHISGQPTINYNDIYNNTPQDVYNANPQGSPKANCTNNWWGTTDEAIIQSHIYDWFDDASLGIVDYLPYLTGPVVAGDATGDGKINVVTDNATSITTNSATLNGRLFSLGGYSSANVSFQWGLTDNYTYETAPLSMNTTGPFSYVLTDLSANTTYHFRAKAVGDDTSYGCDKIFTTLTPEPPPPLVSGIISANTTWTLANSPYIVTGSTLVNPGVTLTIEPGVAVKFSSAKGLQVDGQLVARGTATQPIVFTSNQASPAPGGWVSILFTATSTNATYDGDGNYLSGSIMQYSTVEYGGWNNNPAIKIMSSAPFIDHSTISQNAYTGIYSENGSRKITNNTISYNGGGIFISGGTATISGNTISYNAGGLYSGIYIRGGMATISGNTISYNAGTGIRGSGLVTISGNTISNNSFGGIKLEGGSATITNNTINSNSCSSERSGGGGIGLAYGATANISHNTISNNSAVYGSGIYAGSTGGATISNNIITNNSGVFAGGGFYHPQGGGIYASNGPVTISRNTISNNYASTGGGIYGGGTISNNIISNNSADRGGGIYASGGTISHNQITGNSISSGDGKGGGIHISGQPTINYNDIYNNTPQDVYNANPQGSPNANCTNNWWGTTDEAIIQSHIYDWFDDASLGIVDYLPYLTGLVLPGDANGDGVVNALDITKVERIIVGLDVPTPRADANQDGKTDALDITKVERLIAGLD